MPSDSSRLRSSTPASGVTGPRPATLTVSTSGDMVCGLSMMAPPTPFVGELGDPADQTAQALTQGIVRAGGVPVVRPPKVTINGLEVGTTQQVATALPAAPVAGKAQLPMGTAFVRVAGQPLTLKQAPAVVSPDSALTCLGGMQDFVTIELAPAGGLGGSSTSTLSQLRQSVPSRTSYGAPSAMSSMLSTCSVSRHADMAPGEHQVLVGDPVDVVTGSVVILSTDFEQSSPPLRLQRRYESGRSDRDSSLGHGWCHELDQSIYLEPGRVVFRDGDGREKEFNTRHLPDRVSRPGDVLKDATGRYRLHCVAPFQWELSDGRCVRQFATVDATPDRAQKPGIARLTRVAYPDTSVIDCVYASGLLKDVQLDGSSVLRFEYHDNGRIRRLYASSPAGEVLQAHYEYSAAGDLVRVTDALGFAREYEYLDHLLVLATNREGGSFHYGYRGTGPRARCVRTWGDQGYLSRSLEHDPIHGMTLVYDSYGQPTTYRYNPVGLVTSIDPPDGQTRQYRYDTQLRLIETQWADGTSETATYDDAGHIIARTDRDGSSWTMSYSDAGHLLEGSDAQGGRWVYTHDQYGRIRQLQDPLGHTTRIDFAPRGQTCIVTDATGSQAVIRLNAAGQIVEMPRPGQGRVAYSYDERGRLAAARDSDDQFCRWHYDPYNRLVRQDGLGVSCRWDHSPEGWVVGHQRGTQRTTIARDAFGLVRGIQHDQCEVRYAFDTEGRMLRAQDAETPLISLERALNGLVSAYEAWDFGRCEVQRNPRNPAIIGLTPPDGPIHLERDKAGRLCRVRHPNGMTSTYSYRADGLLIEASNETITCTFERDERGAICEQRWGSVAIDQLNPDHRGRRSGMQLDDDLSVSYLRNSEGLVEDVAIVSGSEVSASIDPEPAGPVVTSAASLALVPDPPPDEPARAFDALWRPVVPHQPEHLVWDEDRCIVADHVRWVHNPDDGRPMFTVSWAGTVQPVSDSSTALPNPKTAASTLDRAHRAAFPAVATAEQAAKDALPYPAQLLRQVLGYWAWNPTVRPIPGDAPWNPDQWEPRVDSLHPDSGRLDSAAILRALGAPHPRPELTL